MHSLAQLNVGFSASKLRSELPRLGQLLLLDDSGKQPSGRLLYLGTCRKVNSHNSAIAAVGGCSIECPLPRTLLPSAQPIADEGEVEIMRLATAMVGRQ